MATRVGLAAADVMACTGSMLVVSAAQRCGASRSGRVVLLPFFVLLAKMAGLYDRDQFILHKTTLDEGPALVAVAAIFALVIEGVQALEFTAARIRCCCGACSWWRCGHAAARPRASWRCAPPGQERLLVIGDAAAMVLVKRKLASDPGPQRDRRGPGRRPNGRSAEGFDKLLGTVDDLPARDRAAPRGARDRGSHPGGRRRRGRRRPPGHGLGRPGGRASAHARGDRHLGGVRRPRRPGAAGRARLRPVALVALPQARLRPRGHAPGCWSCSRRCCWPSRSRSSWALPARSCSARRASAGTATSSRCSSSARWCHDAEDRKHELVERNEAAPLFKIADDPRTTRLGRHLRRHSLDELPQLLNVLQAAT